MSRTNARSRWEELRGRLDQDARASKSSQAVVLELSRQYRALDDSERSEVDGLLAEWVLSQDEGKRFDAMAVIADNHVTHAVPALRELGARLEASDAPSAPFEWAKVNRILGNLHDGGAS